MNDLKLLNVDLTLFDGAAAGGDGAGTGTAAAADGGAQGDTNGQAPVYTRRGKKTGEFDNVVFGKQTDAAAAGEVTNATAGSSQAAAGESNTDVKTTSSTLEDKRRAFQDLINGEYKDIYTEETQRIINRRFKETSQLREQVEQFNPVADLLYDKYKISDRDPKKLMAAIENDDAYWSDAADEAGMSVEAYKELQKLKRQNEALMRAEEQRKGQQFVQQQTTQWYKEAEAVKAKFPKFDFGKELGNPQFVNMLKAGTPVEHAYKVIHYDELMTDAMQVTAANTQKAVIDNVRARGARPQEVGMSSQSAFTVRSDVSKLTKAERAEVARRAKRGEPIVF